MKKPEWLDPLLDEWEFATLVLFGALFFLVLAVATVKWLTAGYEPDVTPGGGGPPIPVSRINYATAYAILDRTGETEPGEYDTFAADFAFRSPRRPKPKPQPPTSTPKPEPEPEPEPPPPTPTSEPEPEPEPDPEPATPPVDIFVYRGYRIDDQGRKVAILLNETTGERVPLLKGQNFRGLFVAEFTNNTITFFRPDGKPHTLGPDDKLPYRRPE